jgi:hypothetical protein
LVERVSDGLKKNSASPTGGLESLLLGALFFLAELRRVREDGRICRFCIGGLSEETLEQLVEDEFRVVIHIQVVEAKSVPSEIMGRTTGGIGFHLSSDIVIFGVEDA